MLSASGELGKEAGVDLQGQLGTIDVTRLRGRRAVNRWERTSVGDVFERLTWSYPEKTAITGRPGAYGEERFASVTYREADGITSQVAHALAARGLEPGARVLLFCENSVEAYLAKVGVAKAGMVAVPVNPALAPDVLEHLIGQAEPGLAIVATSWSGSGRRPSTREPPARNAEKVKIWSPTW